MVGSIGVRFAGALVASLAAAALAASGASAEVVYNNVPASLPGNFASIGLAATSSSEFGGEIGLAGTARKKPVITVVMSSWSCETGTVAENCATKHPGRGFRIPFTVKVYNAAELNEGPVAERTKNLKMLYRPSSTPEKCGGDKERWFDEAENTCYHGFAFPLTVKLPHLKKMPKFSIITFSYPHSEGPAESLNIATSEPPENTLTVGEWPEEGWFVNSTWSGMYESGASDVGTLGSEEGLNSIEGEGINYQPVVKVEAE